MLKIKKFNMKETYEILRFIATEYLAKYGVEATLNVLFQDAIPVYATTAPIYPLSSSFTQKEFDLKTILLACLYKEYPNINKLAFVLKVNRMLSHNTELTYAKRIGIDVSTYRLIERGFIYQKGLIKIDNDTKEFQFDGEEILKQLHISIHELSANLGGYDE